MKNLGDIRPAGFDTAARLNLEKRILFLRKYVDLRLHKILDCGCGTGGYLQYFLDSGFDAYGVEYFEDKVNKFKKTNPSRKERIFVGSIENLSFSSNSFSLVFMNEVLEHVENEERALSEVHRVLSKDGLLALFSPNRLYPFETHKAFLKKSNFEIPRMLPCLPYIPTSLSKKVIHFSARNYWPNELRGLLNKNGFKVIQTGYVWQTFEGLSGQQPFLVEISKKRLRQLSNTLEKLPIIKCFGISQVLLCEKINQK